MNPKARTSCIEVLMNDAEEETLNLLCRLTGMGKSPYLRHLLNKESQAHFRGAPPVKESRACPGIGRVASRSGNMRRHF